MPGGRWHRSRNAVQSVALTQDPGNLPKLDSKLITPMESPRTKAAKENQAKLFGSKGSHDPNNNDMQQSSLKISLKKSKYPASHTLQTPKGGSVLEPSRDNLGSFAGLPKISTGSASFAHPFEDFKPVTGPQKWSQASIHEG